MFHYSDEIIALVPARSGSKSVPHKNIKFFAGKPLIAHSIEQALASGAVSRVLVSTDSEEYAAIARQYGAVVPFLRPPEISGDSATDLECFQHALGWLHQNEGAVPAAFVHLRPTHPNRKAGDIAKAVGLLCDNTAWDSLRSVVPAPETPYKMWHRAGDGRLQSVVECDIPEAHSKPRQILPKVFLQNASIDVIRSRTILEHGSICGKNIGSFVMDEINDIDTLDQFAKAEASYVWANGIPKGKTFVFDIDGVIASITPKNDYTLAAPLVDNIRRINRLYDAGNTIILLTARGFVTGIDWTEVTSQQMKKWGLRHHRLMFGKPASDYYIDDKMMGLDVLARIDTIP